MKCSNNSIAVPWRRRRLHPLLGWTLTGDIMAPHTEISKWFDKVVEQWCANGAKSPETSNIKAMFNHNVTESALIEGNCERLVFTSHNLNNLNSFKDLSFYWKIMFWLSLWPRAINRCCYNVRWLHCFSCTSLLHSVIFSLSYYYWPLSIWFMM